MADVMTRRQRKILFMGSRRVKREKMEEGNE